MIYRLTYDVPLSKRPPLYELIDGVRTEGLRQDKRQREEEVIDEGNVEGTRRTD